MSVEPNVHEELAHELEERAEHPAGLQMCPGCRDLTGRIAELERRIAQLAETQSTLPVLGTRAAYWITIAAHCTLLAIMAAGEDLGGMLLYPFLFGAAGSLAVCHVFPIRGTLHKIGRTALTATCVTFFGFLPWLLQLDSFQDLGMSYMMLLLYFPPLFVVAWFTAKLFVWTRGWRIVPPGIEPKQIRLKIRDILLLTALVALYVSSIRWIAAAADVQFDDSQIWMLAAIGAGGSILGTIACSFFSRAMLIPGRSIQFRWMLAGASTVFACVVMLTLYFVIANGDLQEWPEGMIYLIYALAGTAMCLVSPALTCLLLRFAQYRLVVPAHSLNRTP